AQFPVGTGVTENTIAAGYFERNSHRLVDIDECPVIPERLDLVLNQIKAACGKAGLSPYDEISHTGMLRHISLRQSFFNQEILATLVLNVANLEKLAGRQVERLRSVAEQVREKVPEVVGFCLNFNTLKGNKILSEKTICLSGKPTIEEVLQSHEQERPEALRQGLSFRLSANSFFQVHRQQAVFILDQVFDLVKNRTSASGDAKPLIVDAYAGVGTIAMWLCDLACKVVAVEENPFAVQDGRKNLLLNKIANVEFHQGQAETVLPALYAQGLRPDILILDPPRKGAGSEVLEAVLEMAPELVVYVSCNPATLSRDLKILASGNKAGINWQEQERETQGRFGYKTQRVKPVDLFPQTYHVESIASLERIFFDGTVGNLEEI
ncbi:MAG: 23S rRNA (uracil(1939)-C(5))-methyltransferase RlmD, partial [Candidatus Obscuribacterales bacterium]|nr:23S rRNA (uracil(1939)-C(5))-methyltransferase RlmD [Candidatus Obscuribacterales bacterium]